MNVAGVVARMQASHEGELHADVSLDELSDRERGRFDRLCAIIRAFATAAKNPAVWVGSLTSCLARYLVGSYYMYTDGICWKLKESKT